MKNHRKRPCRQCKEGEQLVFTMRIRHHRTGQILVAPPGRPFCFCGKIRA